MKLSSVLLLASANLVAGRAYRNLVMNVKGYNFFDAFDFWQGRDPTNGFVKYIDRNSAQSKGIISAGNDNVYVGVDNSNIATEEGRESVRMESKQRFTRGLFLLDLAHMPAGCGTWPAFWTLGDNWPNNGEIDIIEGVNAQSGNHMALHTSDGCSTATTQNVHHTGEIVSTNCYVYAPNQSSNQGCAQHNPLAHSYGWGLNGAGGGVYAMEWNSDFIKVWWFPRGSIPSDVFSANPEPLNWGLPAARFSGNCNINSKFQSHRIIFNITFCGDWANGTWGSFPACAAKGNSCKNFVQNNPNEFREAYWLINSLRVFSS